MRKQLINRFRKEAKEGNITNREQLLINLAIEIHEEEINRSYAVAISLQDKKGIPNFSVSLSSVSASSRQEALGIAIDGLDLDLVAMIGSVVLKMNKI